MSAPNKRARRPRAPALWAAIGIILLIAANTTFDLAAGRGPFTAGSFLHLSFRAGSPAGAIIDVANHGAKIAILALGMAIVVALRGIDLSVGSVMAVSGAIAATLTVDGTPAPVAVAAALGASACCGLWNGLLVTVLRLQPFIATLVLMVAGRGLAQMITNGQTVTFQDSFLTFIGNARPAWFPLPFPFLLAIVLLAATHLLTRRSALALLIEAVGSNPEASRLAGVRSRTLIIGGYVFCSACAGMAGLVTASNIKAADPTHAGVNMELFAIFSVVVGGTTLTGGRFSLVGAFVGAMLVQMLTTTMYARNVGADIAPLPSALFILAVCVIGSPRARRIIRQGGAP